MSIEERRKLIEKICKSDSVGFINPEIFQKGYSLETIGIYAILSSYNGRIPANELLHIYDPNHPDDPEVEELCRLSVWALYRDGFIELNTLTDNAVEEISEQLRLGELT